MPCSHCTLPTHLAGICGKTGVGHSPLSVSPQSRDCTALFRPQRGRWRLAGLARRHPRRHVPPLAWVARLPPRGDRPALSLRHAGYLHVHVDARSYYLGMGPAQASHPAIYPWYTRLAMAQSADRLWPRRPPAYNPCEPNFSPEVHPVHPGINVQNFYRP